MEVIILLQVGTRDEATPIRGVSQSQRGTITCLVEREDKFPANTKDEEDIIHSKSTRIRF